VARSARWDLSHLHQFEPPDGRRSGCRVTITRPISSGRTRGAQGRARVGPGQEFSYAFDFGDDWRHSCRVLDEKADPAEEYGATPKGPVAIWGWAGFRISTAETRWRTDHAQPSMRRQTSIQISH
jgi:hypothetical protein